MATDPVTGEWTPDRVIKNRQRYADLLLGQQARSPLEGLVRGLGGGYFSGQADQHEQDNKALEKQSLAGILGAKTQDDLIRAMAGSKVPHHQTQGLGILSQSLDPVRQQQLKTGQQQYEAGTEALRQAKLMNPELLEQVKQAVASAKTKQEFDQMISRLLSGGGAANSAAPAERPQILPPGAPSGVPGVTLQRTDAGAGVMPGGVTQAQFAQPPAGAAPPPSASPTASQDMVNVGGRMMPRDEARRIGFLLTAKPGYAELGKLFTDAAGAEKFGKEGQNEIDKKTINAVNHVSRLREVSESFDPKYLQIPTRIKMAWTSLKSKFGDLTPEQAAEIAPFAEFRRRTVDNMSRLLNELSGAAISPQEYERIKQTQPDAGTGITDGDGPQEFEAKMRGALKSQMRAIARYNYLRTHSPQTLSNNKDLHNAFPLEEIDKVINKRGAEINQQLRQQYPQASPAVIDQQRRAILANEFGIQI
jgi:hypothetical protein